MNANEDLFQRGGMEKPQPATQKDFEEILRKPLLDLPLPRDFKVEAEGAHLARLWEHVEGLRQYRIKQFVFAGGSGMVFEAYTTDSKVSQALKIVRRHVYEHATTSQNAPQSLSPVSKQELLALQKISHPNVVRLYKAIEDEKGVIAIGTTFVEKPQQLDQYLGVTLAKHPDPHGKKGLHPFSPQRLDDACAFLVERCGEIASALAHMHKLKLFHFDVKSANILISETTKQATLTDLGSCIDAEHLSGNEPLRVHFTWTYGHPELTSILTGDPTGITGGGLKVSASVPKPQLLQRFDLFAFGRTIQEALAFLAATFGERCYAAYGFRFLHMISCLLLDGHNAPSDKKKRLYEKDGRKFADDTALGYPIQVFKENRITSADELVEKISRFSRQYSWNATSPELDPWQPEIINTGLEQLAPFTKRVSRILSHPVLRRLKKEPQLGWMPEVFPGAGHNRWSHTIGVFSAVVGFYNSLIADPEVPTVRILLDQKDLQHAFVAALLHDVGQTEFGHDLEEACENIFNHESFVKRLLIEDYWGKPTLGEAIQSAWPQINIERVLRILGSKDPKGDDSEGAKLRKQEKDILRMLDGIASDTLDGPIDADKFDYISRDSKACGVPYGLGFDRARFLQALSVEARHSATGTRFGLAYKAKGSTAVESLLLARYQMYGAVYWHHTYRCIQAMFVHAAAATFGDLKGQTRRKIRNWQVTASIIGNVLYHSLICKKPFSVWRSYFGRSVPEEFGFALPAVFPEESALSLVWRFAEDPIRILLERLAKRDLYKRVYELRLRDLGPGADYATLRSELEPNKRVKLAKNLQDALMDSVHKSMAARKPNVSTAAEDEAQKRFHEVSQLAVPCVVIDFPTRGIPKEKNVPVEMGDPARKYMAASNSSTQRPQNAFFQHVRHMQMGIATFRVFAAPELHELITRYLDPGEVQACVEECVLCVTQSS